MTNLSWFSHYDWEDWGRGLVSAFIGGGTSSFTGGIVAAGVDPTKTFAIGTPQSYKLMASMFVFNGVIMFMQTLNKKPLPDKIVEKTTETTKLPGIGPMVITTVKETTKEPEPPKD